MSSVLLVALFCPLTSTPLVKAEAFLSREIPTVAVRPLLEELEDLLGSDHRIETEKRALKIEEALRATFQAMPKGRDGGLEPDAVRYMLHRFFVDRHGWFVNGLDAAGEAWNSSSPAAIFKEHVGDHVHDFFEERLGVHGFSLHHVAVLAATLENFVHRETLERLHTAYWLMDLSQNETNAGEEQVAGVIDTYMIMYVLGVNHSTVDRNLMNKYKGVIDKVYPTWRDTSKWVKQVQEEVVRARSSSSNPSTSFNVTMQVLEEIGDRYGRWQNSECLDLKDALMKMEEGSSGRVPLHAFYESSLNGVNWQFRESIEYLRQSGALDESDPKLPSVIIPNYLDSPSNCVASSKFYRVCCINECEGLLNHLETHVAAPEAAPSRIAELVSDLPSSTVHAPRILPPSLFQRLEEISSHHHGSIPLHSRLFAQWMHHAYPRECPYPHLSGTTKPISGKEWMKQTGQNVSADKETRRWHVEEAQQISRLARQDPEKVGQLPWSTEEELFVCRPEMSMQESKHAPWVAGRCLMFLAVIFALTLTIVRTVLTAREAVSATTKEKYFV